ncbi:MAG: hypothetical protein SGARI_004769, partial [Bacillariaceae sp.]
MAADTQHFLSVKEKNRGKHLTRAKRNDIKKERSQHKMKKLMEQTVIAKREKAKREGSYKSGMAFGDGSSCGFTAQELEIANKLYNPRRSSSSKKPSKKKSRKDVVCLHCGKTGHSTTRSKKCDLYNGNKGEAFDPQVEADADDAEQMDQMPLDDDIDLLEFHD